MKKIHYLFLIILFASFCFPQAPAPGTPPFGTFQNNGFDIINLANLNVHFGIPIIHKAGRLATTMGHIKTRLLPNFLCMTQLR